MSPYGFYPPYPYYPYFPPMYHPTYHPYCPGPIPAAQPSELTGLNTERENSRIPDPFGGGGNVQIYPLRTPVIPDNEVRFLFFLHFHLGETLS
ncbi:unnamed protein product [Strongylus vulgaris]|uniref:Uncharacterized protein n=1 Tax=Strongylus vulgaris TaxID=40348 RepID=A0A3P7JTN9_STRVU|nr:unnamed protein product [Strongylus vulgaris]